MIAIRGLVKLLPTVTLLMCPVQKPFCPVSCFLSVLVDLLVLRHADDEVMPASVGFAVKTKGLMEHPKMGW